MRVPKGIRIKEISVGTGMIAEEGKIVLVHYDCYLPLGELLESSRRGKRPLQLRVGLRMRKTNIAYGVSGMFEGGIRSMQVPPNIAHQERRSYPDLPPNIAFRYDIELLRVSDHWDNSVA